MSKKSKKKKKAKKKLQKTKQIVQAEKQPVLAEKKEEHEEKKTAKAPKVKKIAKFKTAIKNKKDVIKGKITNTTNKLRETGNNKLKISLILGTALLSLFIQYYVFNVFDPDAIKTSAAQVKTSAQEAYMLSHDFDIINTEASNPGYYLATGETDKDVYSFAVKSTGGNPVVLEEVVLTISGEIPDSLISNVRLFEGESAISKGEFKKDKITFKKITSILQPGTEKKYIVKADVAKEGASGIRFRLSLINPTDIVLSVNDDPVYALDTFPFEGAYTTVVGWRKK